MNRAATNKRKQALVRIVALAASVANTSRLGISEEHSLAGVHDAVVWRGALASIPATAVAVGGPAMGGRTADCCRLLPAPTGAGLCYGDCDCGSFAATCLAFLSPAHSTGLLAKISSSQLSG